MPFIDVPDGDGDNTERLFSFDVLLAATIRCFFSKTLDELGGQPDADFAELDPAFREPLTVGPPIETP